MPGLYPDYPAPIVRNGSGGRELAMARWGMPSSQKALMDATKKWAEKLQLDGGTTNNNVSSSHWRRWLEPANRCLAPFTSFFRIRHHGGQEGAGMVRR
jgi:putative SOS response-associated peptidase YedK